MQTTKIGMNTSPGADKNHHLVLFCLWIPLAVIGLTSFYLFCYRIHFYQDSDMTFWIRAAEEIRQGNTLLTNWIGGYYISPTSDFLWILLFRIFFSRKVTLYLIGPVAYSFLVIVSFFLIRNKNKKAPLWKILILTLPILIIPKEVMVNMLSVGMHGITILYMIVCYLLLDYWMIKDSNPFLSFFLLTFFQIFAGINDQFPIYFFSIPVLFTAVIQWLFTKPTRRQFLLIISTLCGITGSFFVVRIIQSADAMRIVETQFTFSKAADLGSWLLLAYQAILTLFSANYSGLPLFSPDSILVYFGLLFLFIGLIACVAIVKKWKNPGAFTDISLLSGILFCLGAYIFARNNKWLTDLNVLYIYPVLFLLIILTARWALSTEFSNKRISTLVLCAFIAFSCCSLPNRFSLHIASDPNYAELSDYLRSKDVTHVYATYWESHALWYYSDGRIESANITSGADGSIQREHWANKDDWFTPEFNANCIIINRNDSYGVTQEKVFRQFGSFRDFESIGDYDIYIYDENLSEKINP